KRRLDLPDHGLALGKRPAAAGVFGFRVIPKINAIQRDSVICLVGSGVDRRTRNDSLQRGGGDFLALVDKVGLHDLDKGRWRFAPPFSHHTFLSCSDHEAWAGSWPTASTFLPLIVSSTLGANAAPLESTTSACSAVIFSSVARICIPST